MDSEDDIALRPVYRGWPAIASVAWEGYQRFGPGAVFLFEMQTGVPWVGELYYLTPEHLDDATIASDVEDSVAVYDPYQQVVLVYQDHDSVTRIVTLSAKLSPPDAFTARVDH